MKNYLSILFIILTITFSFCGTESKVLKPYVVDVENVPKQTLELNTGYSIGNIRTDNTGYSMIPLQVQWGIPLDGIGLTGWNRGYTQWDVQVFNQFIQHGVESRISGFNMGPEYFFINDNLKVGKYQNVPSIYSKVGLCFADSDINSNDGLGQCFNFQFVVGVADKILLDDVRYVKFGVEYMHISNAGLSEDNGKLNNPIDNLQLLVGYGFNF